MCGLRILGNKWLTRQVMSSCCRPNLRMKIAVILEVRSVLHKPGSRLFHPLICILLLGTWLLKPEDARRIPEPGNHSSGKFSGRDAQGTSCGRLPRQEPRQMLRSFVLSCRNLIRKPWDDNRALNMDPNKLPGFLNQVPTLVTNMRSVYITFVCLEGSLWPKNGCKETGQVPSPKMDTACVNAFVIQWPISALPT